MKTCTRCHEYKDLAEFGKHKQAATGIRAQCKQCCREMRKEYVERNRDKVNEYALKRYHDNPAADNKRRYAHYLRTGK